MCRFTEDGCPHKKFFHTRYLMRMRLTPDCSKMLISTSSGYLLILHDLDLTQSLEVGSYRILRARRAPLSTGAHVKPFIHGLFSKERFQMQIFKIFIQAQLRSVISIAAYACFLNGWVFTCWVNMGKRSGIPDHHIHMLDFPDSCQKGW